MTSIVKYFDIDNFEIELSQYLKDWTCWNVTALGPKCDCNGETEGFFVTFVRE
jgi:hypothetical protein